MPYPEFCRLLAGIGPKTPLGNMVSIRIEEDKDVLKHFTKEQHRIRNEWRSSHSATLEMTDEEKAEAVRKMQQIFASEFK